MAISKLEAKRSKYQLNQVLTLDKIPPPEHIPWGIAQLDFLCRGGWPHGAFTLLSGKEGSGKTTCALLAIRGFQKKYPKQVALYLDAEHRLNSRRAADLGVDLAKVQIDYPASMEAAQAKMTETLLHHDQIGMIVVDSLASLAPQDEVASDPLQDNFIGLGARAANRMYRTLTSLQCKLSPQGRKCGVIVINQERMSKVTYGDPTVLPHGKAQLFLSSLWIRFLSNSVTVDEKYKLPISTNVHFLLLKNISGPPRLSSEFTLNFACANGNGFGVTDDRNFCWLWSRRTGLMTSHGPAGFSFNGGTEKLNKEDWFHKWGTDEAAYAAVKAEVFTKFWSVFDSRGALSNDSD